MPRQQLPKYITKIACIDVFRNHCRYGERFYDGRCIAGYQENENYDIDTEEDFIRASESIKRGL